MHIIYVLYLVAWNTDYHTHSLGNNKDDKINNKKKYWSRNYVVIKNEQCLNETIHFYNYKKYAYCLGQS